MRIRSRLASRVPLDMTPLIDIVFQLLVFFALTLRVAQPEGQFELQLPRGGLAAGAAVSEAPPMIVVVKSNDAGDLQSVSLSGDALAGLDDLHRRVAQLVEQSPHLTTTGRVVLRCDQQLAYEHTVAALGAVSAQRQPDGTLTRLIEQVSLTTPEH
jgi:biopolymer transport protein ExbD